MRLGVLHANADFAHRVRRATRTRRHAADVLMRLRFSLPFVRRRATRRARKGLEQRSVAFVCFGNICRSPFAERLAGRHIESGRRMISAGLYPEEGRRCPEVAVEVARRWGVDLGPHRSRVFTDELAAHADAIFVFDQDNYRRLLEVNPAAKRRVHFIGALEQEGPLFVADPFGSPREFFEQAYGRIAELIAAPQSSAKPGGSGSEPPRR